MIASIQSVRKVQLNKKRLLEREIGWIKNEFKNVYTLSDLDIDNVENYLRFHTQDTFI